MNTAPPGRTIDADPQPPLRILIVRTGAMGDILHGMPAVAALRLALPDSYIGWAVEPHWTPLLRSESAAAQGPSMPLIDRVHPVPTREWKQNPFSVNTLRQIAMLRRELRQARYDVCVDLQGSIRSAVIGRMSGSPRFVGPRRPRERQARAFYSERVDSGSRHVIQQACELVAAGARLPNLQPAQAHLPHDPAAAAWCEHTLHTSGILAGFVLLAPGAGWGAKRWPTERFAELTQCFLHQGIAVLANSSPDCSVPPALSAAGAPPMPSTLPQLIELTRRASLVIGGDTGPVHLAAALNRPVVALFGPTDPDRNGPDFPGAAAIVLRHASSVLDHRRHARTEAGLNQISVSEVFAAAQLLLADPVDTPPCITTEEKVSSHG